MMKKILIILFLIIATFLILFSFTRTDDLEETGQRDIQENSVTIEEKKTIVYEKTPAYDNANYFEEVVTIQGQPMYYAYPIEIDKDEPPKLIIYSHGQLQRITIDLEDSYMLQMKEYGQFFASRGFAFSASNQHDDNWGQIESLDDIKRTIDWFEDNNLLLDEKKLMIGFSMGGLATINYAIENSENIETIALLSPTPKNNLNQEEVNKIKSINLKIWHGEDDINIPISASKEYIEIFKSYGKEVELVTIQNTGHYEIETTIMEKILDFFN